MPAAATWIDRPDALAAAAARWLAAAADVALDTEFVFERTYRPRLGIVQIAVAGEIALIDAVRIPDLSALGPLLADPARRKLLHSGSGDLPILRRAGGAALRGLLDTQIAAAFAGLGPSLSYAALVKTLLGVELAKHETRTDWLRRPLSPDQLRYAAEDVEYLPAVAADLEERLRVLGRLEWALEDSATLATLDGDTPDPEVAWRRVKGIDRLPASARAVARVAGGVARARSRSRSTWRARSCCATKRCWRSPSATRWRRRTPRRCPATTRAGTRTRRRAGWRRCRPRAPTSRPGPRRPRIRGRRPTSAIDSRRWRSGSPRWSRSARPSSAWRPSSCCRAGSANAPSRRGCAPAARWRPRSAASAAPSWAPTSTPSRSRATRPPRLCRRRLQSVPAARGAPSAALRDAERRTRTTLGMPDGKDSDLGVERDVVDVIAGSLQQDAADSRHRRLPIHPSELRCVADDPERTSQFVEEEIRRGEPIPSPPFVDRANLGVGLGSGADLQAHRR